MAKFCDRLRFLRNSKDLTQLELSKFLNISKSSINKYESGEREPSFKLMETIADFFNVDLDYLVGTSDLPNKSLLIDSLSDSELPPNLMPMPKMRKIPLIGSIACGSPILAEEHIEDYIDIPSHIHADFSLTCKGDSMINARIFDGDIVYIRQQSTVESGEIAAVLIESEATLKRVLIYDDHIILATENPTYNPIICWHEEMNTVRILGKAVAFTSPVR